MELAIKGDLTTTPLDAAIQSDDALHDHSEGRVSIDLDVSLSTITEYTKDRGRRDSTPKSSNKMYDANVVHEGGVSVTYNHHDAYISPHFFPSPPKRDYGLNSPAHVDIDSHGEETEVENEGSSTTSTFKQRMLELRRSRGSSDDEPMWEKHSLSNSNQNDSLVHQLKSAHNTTERKVGGDNAFDIGHSVNEKTINESDDEDGEKPLQHNHTTATTFGSRMRTLRRQRKFTDTTSFTFPTRKPKLIVERPRHVTVSYQRLHPTPLTEYKLVVPNYEDVFEIEVIEDQVVEVVEECTRLQDEQAFQLKKCYCSTAGYNQDVYDTTE